MDDPKGKVGNMKKTERTILTALAFIAASSLAGCNDPGYKITGDNKKEIEQYSANRANAIEYLLKTSVYVGEIRDMKSLPVGQDLPAQHKKMLALRSEGDKLGDMFSPLSHCRNAGYKAQEYWSVVAGNIATETPEEALTAYVEAANSCQGQIDSGPTPITYLETSQGKKPPVEGCLKVVSLGADEKKESWTCPTALLSKL